MAADRRVYRAPGRVNLIGEHTDYNDGFVMPMAIDRFTRVTPSARGDGRLAVHSEAMGDAVEARLDAGALRPRGDWSDYVYGVAKQLLDAGIPLQGATLRIASDVPLGAGLSSSASLEVAVASALVDGARATIDRMTLARLCQRAEHEFAGAHCGIMDQFIALHGRAGHALLLDCRSLAFAAIALPARTEVVIGNTMVRHSIAAGEYNARRAECEAAARALAARLPDVRALRDVSPDDLDRHAGALSDIQLKRARHVVTENARVQAAAERLERGALDAFGALMAESHRSLRDDFEVSCRELDAMVDVAAACDGVYGARMTGGGFGGCAIALVDAAHTEAIVRTLKAGYQQRTGITPEIYICSAADGCTAADA